MFFGVVGDFGHRGGLELGGLGAAVLRFSDELDKRFDEDLEARLLVQRFYTTTTP